MKRAMIIVVLIGMFGWAMYEFIVPKASDSTTEEASDSVNLDDSDENGDLDVGLDAGNKAPDFKLATLEGEELSLSDLQGERVLLNFWATWCPPCRAEMPDMEKFHQNEDIQVLSVNLTETESSLAQIEDFKEEYELSFSVALDEDLVVANMYKIQPIPTSYMIDSEGVIQNMAFGALTYEQMIQSFEGMD